MVFIDYLACGTIVTPFGAQHYIFASVVRCRMVGIDMSMNKVRQIDITDKYKYLQTLCNRDRCKKDWLLSLVSYGVQAPTWPLLRPVVIFVIIERSSMKSIKLECEMCFNSSNDCITTAYNIIRLKTR